MKTHARRAARCLYEFGDFRLDPVRHRLSRGGKIVPLSPKAIETLIVLVRNAEEAVDRKDLMQAVWADSIVEDANLTVAISQLRKAFVENGNRDEFIQTVPRVGYRFVADVREILEESLPLRPEKHASSQTTRDETNFGNRHSAGGAEALQRFDSQEPGWPSPLTPKRSMFFSRTSLVMAAGVVVLSLGALKFYQYLRGRHMVEPASINSVAVLPLRNLTGNPADEYFAERLTEGLINALSKIEGLKVVSRGPVFAKGTEIDPREAGKRLKVMSIMEGTILKDRDSARVSVRLVSTEDGRVLWTADTLHRSLDDIFVIEDKLARSATGIMRSNLRKDETRPSAKRYTNNAAAYQFYTKGRYFWNKRTGPDLERAIYYFDQAIKLDPNYALAYAGLADCYVVLGYLGHYPVEEAFRKVRSAAETALAIDSRLSEPHAALGVVSSFDWDWPRAQAEFNLALHLSPDYATAHHWYSWHLMNMGRHDDSVREMERALELDPVSIEINSDLGAVLCYARRPDEAIERSKAALEMDPNFLKAHVVLGRAHQQKGEFQQAIAALERGRELSKNRHDILAELGCIYALVGEREKALEFIVQLKASSKEATASPYHFARIHVALDEKEKALAALEEACEARAGSILELNYDPFFDSLRAEPRVRKILHSIGLVRL